MGEQGKGGQVGRLIDLETALERALQAARDAREHGLEHRATRIGPSTLKPLERQLGDVHRAIAELCAAGDTDEAVITLYALCDRASVASRTVRRIRAAVPA